LRKFYDLYIVASTEDIPKFLERGLKLGYRGIAISGLSISTREKLEIDLNVEIISRLDLYFDRNIQAKRILRKERRNFEIIVAHPKNVNAARFSARDRRIDMINFHGNEHLFGPVQAKLMANEGKILEVCLKRIRVLNKKSSLRTLFSIIRRYYNMLTLAREMGVDVVCSSGASDPYEMHPPRDIAAFISTLGLGDRAIYSLSKIPMSIVERNRLKLSNKFIAPGVMLLDE